MSAERADHAKATPQCIPGVLIGVSDHAVERFRQRVASRRGELDARPEIVARVSDAWSAGRFSQAPARRGSGAQRGVVHVRDLLDRDLVFICRHDPRARELIVITLWERARLGSRRVPRRFTDALEEKPRPSRAHELR